MYYSCHLLQFTSSIKRENRSTRTLVHPSWSSVRVPQENPVWWHQWWLPVHDSIGVARSVWWAPEALNLQRPPWFRCPPVQHPRHVTRAPRVRGWCSEDRMLLNPARLRKHPRWNHLAYQIRSKRDSELGMWRRVCRSISLSLLHLRFFFPSQFLTTNLTQEVGERNWNLNSKTLMQKMDPTQFQNTSFTSA